MNHKVIIDDMNPDATATGWTVLGNDTTNLAGAAVRLFNNRSLEFDKADGAAGTVYAGAYKTIVSSELDQVTTPTTKSLTNECVEPWDRVVFCCYFSAVTDVVSAFVRIGTSANNYLEFKVLVADLQAGWNLCEVEVGNALLGGTGWNPDALTYLLVGAEFSAQDDELANILFDRVQVAPAALVRT